MSYILDALKKSEAKRNLLNPPTKSGRTEAAPKTSYRLFVWAVIAIVAVIFIGWLMTRQHPPEVTHEPPPIPANPSDTPSPPAPATVETEDSELPVSVSAKDSVKHGSTLIKPAAPVSTNEDLTIDSHDSIPDYSGLSEKMAGSLPSIHIEGHVFDEKPSARLVIINGKLHREGQNITRELILEKITADGAVLNHQGSLFRISVFSSQK